MNEPEHLEELDLSIPNMRAPEHEAVVGATLRQLPGVVSVRLVEAGALVNYRASAISHEQICDAVRQAGFRASTFQDSATGETGSSPV